MGVADLGAGSMLEGNATSEVLALVHAALDPRGTTSLSDLLGRVAAAADAVGCVLWESVPSSPCAGERHDESLFVLESWFQDPVRKTEKYVGVFTRHDLPIAGSLPGRAIRTGQPAWVDDITVDGGAERGQEFPGGVKVMAACAYPASLPGVHDGALSLYRDGEHPFTAAEVDRLSELVRLIPPLYQAMRDRASFALLKDVEKELQQAESDAVGRVLSKDEKKKLIQRLCERVAKTINCLEVSVYLNDRLDDRDNYRRMGSTLGESDTIGEDVYHKTEQDDGLTGWVLHHAIPIRIFDLRTFDQDEKNYHKTYPNIRWKDKLNIKEKALREFGLEEAQEAKLPPLSVMAAPIILGSEAIGAIRCSVGRGPYYFAERDERLLKVVADQIAQCWSTWLSRREVEREVEQENEENEAWRKFVDGTRTLNEFVQAQADKEYPDEIKIFEEALRLVSRVVPEASVTSIRVHNVKDNVLQFAVIHPRPSDADYMRRFFRLEDGIPSSAGAYVMRTGKLYEIPDVKRDPYYVKDGLPDVRRMLIAPLTTDNDPNNCFGVIDLRGLEERRPFPRYAGQVVELLGRQLGMYHRLVTTIIELKRQQRTRVQAWKDLSHQLKSPILLARKWADMCLRESQSWRTDNPDAEAPAIDQSLFAIRGLCRKANRVTKSLGMLEDLASSRPIELRKTRLVHAWLMKMLIEASMDSRILVDPRRQIRFGVDEVSFRVAPLMHGKVIADTDLLEQAVSNILDNASKYSHPNTPVRIFGGLTNKRQFHISVTNYGIRIASHEVRDCARREWRSDAARLMTQEGSGIGLWVVDKIMEAHRGHLVIQPTRPDDLTEVKLVFPVTDVPVDPDPHSWS
jgi:signal transduction histidine kinase